MGRRLRRCANLSRDRKRTPHLVLNGARLGRMLRRLPAQLFRLPDLARQPQLRQSPDDVPAQINLPPAATEARRVGVRVMIAMPVLAPCAKLQRAQPPDIAA